MYKKGMDESVWIPLVAALVAGCVCSLVFVPLRSRDKVRLATLEEELKQAGELQNLLTKKEAELAQCQEVLNQKGQELAAARATLESERLNFATQEKKHLELLDQAQEKLTSVFKSLSADTLRFANEELIKRANEQFLAQQKGSENELEKRKIAIENLLKPIQEQMEKLRIYNSDMEKNREGAYQALNERVKSLAETQQSLDKQAGRLVSALKDSKTRGSWGEIQLRRVVEMAGMLEHCDFEEQVSTTTQEGRLRPDMVIHLPQKKTIIIDAKATLDSYLKALECEDHSSEQKELLKGHARQLRDIVKKLGNKDYVRQFDPAPEFVVMFLPGEGILSAAWSEDPEIMEFAFRNNVIIATPTTLVAMLSTVAQCWKESRVSEEIHQIVRDSSDFYERICTLLEHLSLLGDSLRNGVSHYNKLIGSLESRLMPALKKMDDHRNLLKINPKKVLSTPEPLADEPRLPQIEPPGQKG